MASKPESPTEPFKRALAHAARSLALIDGNRVPEGVATDDAEAIIGGDASVRCIAAASIGAAAAAGCGSSSGSAVLLPGSAPVTPPDVPEKALS